MKGGKLRYGKESVTVKEITILKYRVLTNSSIVFSEIEAILR